MIAEGPPINAAEDEILRVMDQGHEVTGQDQLVTLKESPAPPAHSAPTSRVGRSRALGDAMQELERGVDQVIKESLSR